MKKLISLLLCGTMLIGSAAAFTFEPLDTDQVLSTELKEEIAAQGAPSAWAADEVDAAIAAGLVPHLTDEPGYQDIITREQFAELAVCAALEMLDGEMHISPASFSDTDNPSVEKAAGLGIVNGVGEGVFDPKAATNREQIAAMLYRAWDLIEIPAASQGLDAYTDSASVSPWAAEAVGAMTASGIMKGTSITTLSPADPCTVEQAILLVYRLYQEVK